MAAMLRAIYPLRADNRSVKFNKLLCPILKAKREIDNPKIMIIAKNANSLFKIINKQIRSKIKTISSLFSGI
jgi:hypothetical protein